MESNTVPQDVKDAWGLDMEQNDFDDFHNCRLFTVGKFSTFGHGIPLKWLKERLIQFVDNDFSFEPPTSSPIPPQVVHVHGGTGINIANVLTNSSQSISIFPGIDVSQRQSLESLIQQLQGELEKVPDERQDDAEAVATLAAQLVESAKTNNKTLIDISADGLKKAATTLKEVTPTVLNISLAVIQFISQLKLQ